jgi:hypothetical protein
MAYDLDGSVGGWMYYGGSISEWSAGQMTDWNRESGTAVPYNGFNGQSGYAFVLFPQLRDLVGYAFWARSDTGWNVGALQTSTNTTNGYDGSWTTVLPTFTSNGSWSGPAAARTAIRSVTANGIKAVRFESPNTGGNSARMEGLHLYGRISNGQTADRLRFWHPTLDEALDDNTAADGAWLDWAETTRGTSADKTFRIKNNSSTLTANGIVLTTSALTDTTPSVPPQMTFSDGGVFSASLNIGNLAPGALSSVITIRRTTPANAILSLWWARIKCDPTSWS